MSRPSTSLDWILLARTFFPVHLPQLIIACHRSLAGWRTQEHRVSVSTTTVRMHVVLASAYVFLNRVSQRVDRMFAVWKAVALGRQTVL